RAEPFPVPRQQRDLASNHTEFWPAATARLACLRDGVACLARFQIPGESCQHVRVRPAQVKIDGTSGQVVEDRDRSMAFGMLDRERDLVERARCKTPLALEGCKGCSYDRSHRWCSLSLIYYPGKSRMSILSG